MYATDDNKTTINPRNITTGGPVEGGCCYTSFAEEPTLPTSASESIVGSDSEWDNLGELSDHGWSQSVSTTVNKFKGYHGNVLLSEIADEEATFKAEFLEVTRTAVLRVRYGDENVTVDATGFATAMRHVSVPNRTLPLVFDELLSNGVKQRTVFPRAKIDSIDDQAHQKGALLVYGMTFTAAADENGVLSYVYRAKRATPVLDGGDTGGGTGGGADGEEAQVADATLSALSIGSLELTPAFGAETTVYAASTTNATDTVTATATDEGATVAITVGESSVESGAAATWQAGENTVTVTVTNGTETKTYVVTVTKS